MATEWITVDQAAELLKTTPEEVIALMEADQVESLSAGDVKGPIRLVPRDYVERKTRQADPGNPAEGEAGPGEEQAQKVDVETLDEDAVDSLRPVQHLTEVMTDRYEAIVEALRQSESTEIIEQNLVELRGAFEVTTEAITHIRELQATTAAGLEDTLRQQHMIMENLLTALQSADQNTASVVRYQQDFIDAIRQLPEPLQSIQDVQLGLIELEEKRQQIEQERARFEETDFGRLMTMLVYVLLAAMLIGMLSLGWAVGNQLPALLEQLRANPGRGVVLEWMQLIC